jgi:hypothetical protein
MGFILVGRHKKNPDVWHDMNGIYEYPNKSDFGSLARIKRDCPDYDLMIIDRAKFNRAYGQNK